MGSNDGHVRCVAHCSILLLTARFICFERMFSSGGVVCLLYVSFLGVC